MANTVPGVDTVWQDFHDAVNMTSPQLRDWLLAGPVWQDTYGPEPEVDIPALGQQVLQLLHKRRTDLTEHDLAVMRQVTDLINGRLAQRPADDADQEPWRHTLMTLGHDPLRDGPP